MKKKVFQVSRPATFYHPQILLKHSTLYLFARGLPGLINFLTLTLYTRLLPPKEFGQYAIIISGIGFFNAIFFQWLRLGLLRFLPANCKNQKSLLSAILLQFMAMSLLTGGIGLLIIWFWPDVTWRRLIAVAIPLLWAQAWFEINLELAHSRLAPMRYGILSISKALSALGLGVLFILCGLGVYGPLIGLLAGMLLSGLLLSWREWHEIDLFMVDKAIIWKMIFYGLPVIFTFFLNFIINSSDRFLIGRFLGMEAIGYYVAGYSLSQQSLEMLMIIITQAGYPLAVYALEQEGVKSSQMQLRQNAVLLLAVSVPVTVVLCVLAPNISRVVLGIKFWNSASMVIPWIAIAIFLAGFRAFYFDLAFQLGKRTSGLMWVMGPSALLNLGLNLWWIPIYGIFGSVYAIIITYTLALILSVLIGRKVFILPIVYKDALKIILSAGIMAGVLWFTRPFCGFFFLLAQIILGSVVYLVCLLTLNIEVVRKKDFPN